MTPALRTYLERTTAFASGESSPRALLDESIALYDAWEPKLQAFVNVDFDAARTAADAATKRWQAGTPLSPIDGMPMGIKDVIETAGLPTEMGSPLFAGWKSGRDSASVAALRDAGAVIVGKNVTTEFASSGSVKSRNPHDTSRTPGASSAGGAAAVGAGIVTAALCTQGLASIVRPAGYCGCFGYKPTVGGINRGGSFDFLSQSAQGVIGASLADTWAVALAIVARIGGDPGTTGIVGPTDLPLVRTVRRVALLETAGWPSATDEAKQQLALLTSHLRALGVTVDDRNNSDAIEQVERAVADAVRLSRRIHTWEFRWPINTLARDRDRLGLSKAMQERLVQAERMTVDQYRAAIGERAAARAHYEVLRGTYDFVLALTASGAPPLAESGTGDPVFAVPGSLLGVPALSLPILRCEGMPFGAQLLGFAHEDAALFAAASWLMENQPENNLRGDRPPAV